MPSSTYDFESYATVCAQDNGRWDILNNSINNIRFTVPAEKTITLTIDDVANLPGIAAKYLGSRFLWYVLLHYNGLYDSLNDLKPGMTLRIPQLDPLLNALKNGSRGSSGLSNNLIVI